MMGQGMGLVKEWGLGMGRDGSTQKPLPKHLGHETGHLCGGSPSCGCGPTCLHLVLVEYMVQGLSFEASAQALEDLFPCLLPMAMSVRIHNISALLCLGGKQLFICNFSLLPSSHTAIILLALSLPSMGLFSYVAMSNSNLRYASASFNFLR